MHCRANTVYTNAYYFLSLHKKLEKFVKDKLDCELVSEWMKSLVNQYKWSAASMPDVEMLTRSGKSGHQ